MNPSQLKRRDFFHTVKTAAALLSHKLSSQVFGNFGWTFVIYFLCFCLVFVWWVLMIVVGVDELIFVCWTNEKRSLRVYKYYCRKWERMWCLNEKNGVIFLLSTREISLSVYYYKISTSRKFRYLFKNIYLCKLIDSLQ